MPKNPLHTGKVLDVAGNTLFNVVTGGTFTTAGGDDTETITDSIIEAADLVIVMLKTEGSTPRTVDAASANAGSITVTLSGDPSTDHVLQYVALRTT